MGINARRKLESSGGSSGIGSDLAPSPERNEYPRHDNHSTSGMLEDYNVYKISTPSFTRVYKLM